MNTLPIPHSTLGGDMTDYVTLILDSDSERHRKHLVELVNEGTFELDLWGGDDDYITNFDTIKIPGCWEIADIEVKHHKQWHDHITREKLKQIGILNEMIHLKLRRVN